MNGLASFAGSRFGDYRAAYRFGRLGYDLVEKRGLTRYQARTYNNFAVHVLPGRGMSRPSVLCCFARSMPQTGSAI